MFVRTADIEKALDDLQFQIKTLRKDLSNLQRYCAQSPRAPEPVSKAEVRARITEVVEKFDAKIAMIEGWLCIEKVSEPAKTFYKAKIPTGNGS